MSSEKNDLKKSMIEKWKSSNSTTVLKATDTE